LTWKKRDRGLTFFGLWTTKQGEEKREQKLDADGHKGSQRKGVGRKNKTQ